MILAEMTWAEAARLDPARTVAILPVGAIEAHGLHLPLETDGIIAEAMARSAAARLERRGLVALVLPPLPYSPAPFAAGFPGTVSISPETLTALVVDLARSLAPRVASLALANPHLDPAHLGALHEAAVRLAGVVPVAFPDLTRRPWAPRLGQEFRSGACHAGRYETSVVMAARPEMVRDEVRRSLPDNPASLSVAIREGKRTFEEAGGPQAYFGCPAAATAAEGQETLEVLGAILEEAVMEVLA